MTRPQTIVRVDKAHQLDYAKLSEIVRDKGGWLRSSGGPEGETAEVWHGDTEYIFSGAGLIAFLYAIKDRQTEDAFQALDFCEYVIASGKEPPSTFVRDAIVAHAQALQARIKGES